MREQKQTLIRFLDIGLFLAMFSAGPSMAQDFDRPGLR